MLSQEKNQLLCSVGPDTPGGQMFRSMWLPALLSSQLPQPGCAPVRLKLLGEELLAIRDGQGVGIIQAHCAHRRAPLFFGKMEEEGIRCAYHGWLYDRRGQCVDMPSESNKALCRNVKLTSYATVEKADIIWVYMGSGEPPKLPNFAWIGLPANQRLASVWLQETNWFQGVEGEVDSSHVSTLHKSKVSMSSSRVHRHYTMLDPNPKFFIKDSKIGFMSVARRMADERFYWRVTQWMAPMYTLIPSAAWPIGGRAWVPIDDENTYCWDFNYNPSAPFSDEFYAFIKKGLSFPPETEYRPYRLNTGTIIDTHVPKRTRYNDYLVDRELQKTFSTTGIHGVNDQDRAMQEGMGRIVDRSKEMLVSGDIAVVTARRKVLDILQSPEAMQKFRESIADGEAFAAQPIDAVSDASELSAFLAEQGLQ